MVSEASRDAFLAKADESLAGAMSELANGRYNNCANRCYYACFQAAIAALIDARISPPGSGRWGHSFVPAQFEGVLINRRKLYPTDLRNVLSRTYALRQGADYGDTPVGRTEVERVLRRATAFVQMVRNGGGRR